MTIVDQIGQELVFEAIPKKVFSCVPSITEYLFYIGLEDIIIGRTKFCVHPANLATLINKYGGTKNLHIDKIIDIQPELVIANKEENTKEDIDKLVKKGLKVYVSDVKNVSDSFQLMYDIALIFEKTSPFNLLHSAFKDSIKTLTKENNKSCLYLIWKNPYMSIGGDTFISSMLSTAGFQNILSNFTRYPIVEFESFQDTHPEYIFLSSEPFPFKEKHRMEIQNNFPNSIVKLVDGEYFSWYGNRMLEALDYFKSLQ